MENWHENVCNALMSFVFVGPAGKNEAKFGWWVGSPDAVFQATAYPEMNPLPWDFQGVHAEYADALNAGIRYCFACRPDFVREAREEANRGQAYRAWKARQQEVAP